MYDIMYRAWAVGVQHVPAFPKRPSLNRLSPRLVTLTDVPEHTSLGISIEPHLFPNQPHLPES